ncbi:putative arsenite efflux transporter [Moniliophthora roreri]|nr:putative arsenite efflux transporter [Moniliophthora roreri]
MASKLGKMPSHDFFLVLQHPFMSPKPSLKYRLCQHHQRQQRQVMPTFWFLHQTYTGLMEILSKSEWITRRRLGRAADGLNQPISSPDLNPLWIVPYIRLTVRLRPRTRTIEAIMMGLYGTPTGLPVHLTNRNLYDRTRIRTTSPFHSELVIRGRVNLTLRLGSLQIRSEWLYIIERLASFRRRDFGYWAQLPSARLREK